jgi:hypothetical protein
LAQIQYASDDFCSRDRLSRELLGGHRLGVGVAQGGGETFPAGHGVEISPIILPRILHCVRGIVAVHWAALLAPR